MNSSSFTVSSATDPSGTRSQSHDSSSFAVYEWSHRAMVPDRQCQRQRDASRIWFVAQPVATGLSARVPYIRLSPAQCPWYITLRSKELHSPGFISSSYLGIAMLVKGKCRLVFSSKGQRPGIDYDFKSSHHPSWAIIRMHLAWIRHGARIVVYTDDIIFRGAEHFECSVY
eukprot:m.23273 g.23273  ORF g.23273 m.23273 type:complete len:171 (-) comp12930_c0_seq1:267-779(-)